MCSFHKIALNSHVIGQELNWKSVIGSDAANLGCSIDNDRRLSLLNEINSGIAVEKIADAAINADNLFTSFFVGAYDC